MLEKRHFLFIVPFFFPIIKTREPSENFRNAIITNTKPLKGRKPSLHNIIKKFVKNETGKNLNIEEEKAFKGFIRLVGWLVPGKIFSLVPSHQSLSMINKH